MIIIDEISMVKSDMLYQLDLRLQEITQKYNSFGGISIFVFGDLMQLKPVMGNYIFEDPRHDDYIQSLLANPRWKMFQFAKYRSVSNDSSRIMFFLIQFLIFLIISR